MNAEPNIDLSPVKPMPIPGSKTMPKYQVWYHANCDDGFGAAWAAKKFFEEQKILHEVVFIPVAYGKPAPSVSSDQIIYIVDFSYDRETLTNIKTLVKNLIILDHHKTAQDALKDFPNAIFDMDRSGAVITWNYFHNTPVPLLLRYVQANDLWRHKSMMNCQAMIRYIRTVPREFIFWDKLNDQIETRYNEVLIKALAVESYFQTQMNYIADDVKFINFDGHTVPVVNSNYVFCSEVCNELLKRWKTPFAISWFSDCNNEVKVSLRSMEIDNQCFDVGALAKKHGGGGHVKAAGFQKSLDVWMSILTTPVHFKDNEERLRLNKTTYENE